MYESVFIGMIIWFVLCCVCLKYVYSCVEFIQTAKHFVTLCFEKCYTNNVITTEQIPSEIHIFDLNPKTFSLKVLLKKTGCTVGVSSDITCLFSIY